MTITYIFEDGEKSDVEVDTMIGTVITELRRKEDSEGRKMRRHCYSLDALQYEGIEYSVPDFTDSLFSVEIESEMIASVRDALSHLSDTQQRRLLKYADGQSVREIARQEHKDFSSVRESIKAAKKKFQKFYHGPHQTTC